MVNIYQLKNLKYQRCTPQEIESLHTKEGCSLNKNAACTFKENTFWCTRELKHSVLFISLVFCSIVAFKLMDSNILLTKSKSTYHGINYTFAPQSFMVINLQSDDTDLETTLNGI